MRTKLPTFEVEDLNRSKLTATIRIHPQAFQKMGKTLEPYKALPRRLRPAMERVGDHVRMNMIPYTFEKEGPNWKPLAKRTQRERAMQGYGPRHPILQRSRDLYNELTKKSHPKHIEIVKVGKYARIEIGGSSEKFVQNQMGVREQRLPARPMIPGTGNLRVNPRDKTIIRNILLKAIKNDRL